MTTISAHVIDRFRGGERLVQVVSEPGVTKVMTKAGVVDHPFKPGDVALTAGDGTIIVGPASFAAVLDFAERVLNGDQRAGTDPIGLQMLAAAIVAISSIRPPDDPLPQTIEAVAVA